MPADYNIPMTDAQITQALQLMVERVSEGWAQGTYDGSPVGSGSPYYQNNSKYWATRATDAAARAEAAVPAGTAGAVFFDRAQTLTDAQAMQARQNIKAGGSNPNLLMNPWFTVNQRGFTSTSSNNTYTVDRWIAQNMRTSGVCSVSDNIITLDATNAVGGGLTFGHSVDIEEMAGKTVTLSVMLSNGNVYSASATLPARTTSQQVAIGTYIGSSTNYQMRLYVNASGASAPYSVQFIAAMGSVLNIKAVKLELGTVSTLANDTAPNYQQELAKCQRYFIRLDGNPTAGGCYTATNTRFAASFPLPVTMRATPTLSGSGSYVVRSTAGDLVASAISVDGITPNAVKLLFTTTAATARLAGMALINGYIDLSADL